MPHGPCVTHHSRSTANPRRRLVMGSPTSTRVDARCADRRTQGQLRCSCACIHALAERCSVTSRILSPSGNSRSSLNFHADEGRPLPSLLRRARIDRTRPHSSKCLRVSSLSFVLRRRRGEALGEYRSTRRIRYPRRILGFDWAGLGRPRRVSRRNPSVVFDGQDGLGSGYEIGGWGRAHS